MGKRKVIYILIILAFFLHYGRTQDVFVDWERLQSAWKEYIEYPSSENALKVYLLLPEKERVMNVEEQCLDLIFDFDNFSILEHEIYAGERNAVRVAFRLLNIADGHYTEELWTTLGNLIRIHPKLFLETLKEHMHIEPIKEIGPPVEVTGHIFVDRFKAQELEKKLRIKALESVKDKGLRKIRDKCIEILKKDCLN